MLALHPVGFAHLYIVLSFAWRHMGTTTTTEPMDKPYHAHYTKTKLDLFEPIYLFSHLFLLSQIPQ